MHRNEIDNALTEEYQAAEEGYSEMEELLEIICEENNLPNDAVKLALATARDRELAELDFYSFQDAALAAQWETAYNLIRRAGHAIETPSWVNRIACGRS